MMFSHCRNLSREAEATTGLSQFGESCRWSYVGAEGAGGWWKASKESPRKAAGPALADLNVVKYAANCLALALLG